MSKRRSLVQVEHLPGMTVARVSQRSLIGGGDVDPVARRLLALAETSVADRIVLDLHEVSALSSLALAVLVQLFRRLYQDGRGLTLSRVRPALMEIFQICRLDALLDVRGCVVPLTVPPPLPLDAAFLEDIASSPDEDAPRLIFADWLEDQDRPGDAGRAEFIRLQYGGGESGAARAQELLESHGPTWVGPLRACLKGWQFRRGFVEDVTLSAGAFLDHGAELVRWNPVRRVRLSAVRGFLPLLSACPHLARIQELSVDLRAATREDVDLLSRSPYLAATKLELVGRSGSP